jgi:hypothetical protein
MLLKFDVNLLLKATYSYASYITILPMNLTKYKAVLHHNILGVLHKE